MTYWHLTRQNRDLILLCAMLRRLFENMSPAITAHFNCLGCSSTSDSYALEVHSNLLGRVLCWFGDNRMRYSSKLLREGYIGEYYYRVTEGDTRSLDHSSNHDVSVLDAGVCRCTGQLTLSSAVGSTARRTLSPKPQP